MKIIRLHFRQSARCHAIASRSSDAFTLVEVLVAMTVLLLLVVCVVQLTNGTASTVIQSRKYIDADSQARAVFSRMALDLGKMLQRNDVDYSSFKNPGNMNATPTPSPLLTAKLQVGNDQMAFYSEGPGYYSGGATTFTGNTRTPVSMVAYNVQADPSRPGVQNLQRVSKALGWDPDPSGTWLSVAYLPTTLTGATGQWPTLFTSDPDYTTVGDQIFRFEYTYLLKTNYANSPGTQNPALTPAPPRLSVTPWDTTALPAAAHIGFNAFGDVAAIVVAIAVLDTSSRTIVPTSSFPSLIAALPDAQDGVDIQTSWNSAVNGTNGYPNFATTAQIPKAAAASVRIYQRYFYLDGH